jgi:hypothetical protein
VGPQDASITAAAISAEDGRPVVVDGAFGAPKTPGEDYPDTAFGLLNGNLPSTVITNAATAAGVENGDVRKVDANCDAGGYSVFGGGFTLDGSVWGHTAITAVLSRTNDYSATLVTPPSNPSLGVLRASATLRVTTLCSRDRKPLVFNDGPMAAAAARRSARRQRRMRGTVLLARKSVGGIVSGKGRDRLREVPRRLLRLRRLVRDRRQLRPHAPDRRRRQLEVQRFHGDGRQPAREHQRRHPENDRDPARGGPVRPPRDPDRHRRAVRLRESGARRPR